MKQVALLSCQKPLDAFVTSTSGDFFRDDEVLIRAFLKRGIRADRIPWDAEDVDWASYDCAFVRSTWDYYTRCAEFLNRIETLSDEVAIWNSPPVIRWNTNKKYLLEFIEHGVGVVPTVLMDGCSFEDAARIASDRGWKRYVLKPCISGGALATYRLPEDSAKSGEKIKGVEGGFLLQPYLPAIETEGEWSFIFFGKDYQYAVKKTAAPGDYRVQSIYGGQYQMATPSPADLKASIEVMEALDDDVRYARVDMVRDEKGNLALMELELIEPYLFFNESRFGADTFVDSVLA